MINEDKFIRKEMSKLCLKNGITLDKVALSVSYWIGNYAKVWKVSDKKQVELGELLNKGYQKGLFGDEL